MKRNINFHSIESSIPSPLVGEGQGEGAFLRRSAKTLRKNMTDVERDLWYQLRAKRFDGFKFKRQVPIKKYILDFVCFEKKLIIELDGGQHVDQADHDAKRDLFFEEQGFRVLRFWNNDVVENKEGVLQMILRALHESPLPNPLPQGERELCRT
jgi:very-short-patch-repair endonuclease